MQNVVNPVFSGGANLVFSEVEHPAIGGALCRLPFFKRRSFSRTLFIMKLTAILLLAGCLQISAKGLSQGLTLSKRNAPLQEVLKEIEKQTGYQFFYKEKVLEGARAVTIDVKNAGLEQVLQACFKNQPLTYTIVDKIVVVTSKSPNYGAVQPGDMPVLYNEPPPIDVRGRIINEKGQPVVASVQVKGTNKGITTSDNGEFELKGIDGNATLVISGVSIETFEVNVNGRSELALNARIKTAIEENVMVEVNTGYQKIPKERATGSFGFVNNSELNRKVGTDILSRLEGVTTGILFDRRNTAQSKLGFDKNNIMIRGLSTLNGSIKEPLIIVNNFPYEGDINNINPNDVESITILKDAAAASIWGARAANGVIVITTKEGQLNKPVQVSINTNINVFQKPDLFYYDRISTRDYIEIETFLFNKGFYNGDLTSNTYPAVTPVVDILARKRAGLITAADSAAQLNTLAGLDVRNSFSDYFYRRAVNQQYALNITGGSNAVKYFLSGGFDKNHSVLVGNDLSRATFFSNISFDLAKNLALNLRVNYNNLVSTNNNPGDFGAPDYEYYKGKQLYPYAQFADANGNSLPTVKDYRAGYTDTAGAGKLLDWKYRPLDELRSADKGTNQKEAILYAGLTYRVLNSLDFQVNYQYQNMNGTQHSYYSDKTYYTRNLINLYSQIQGNNVNRIIPRNGILLMTYSEAVSHIGRAQANFSRVFHRKHDVNAIAGAEIRERVLTSNGEMTYGYNPNTLGVASMDYLTRYPLYGNRGTSTILQVKNFYKGTDHFVSAYANASYIFDRRFGVSTSVRRDASNLFGVDINDKWKPFWTVGASWNISNERFYKVSFIEFLKLRATYGYQGNVNNSLAPYTIIEYSPTPLPLNNSPYAIIRVPANPGLSWENLRQVNLGIDFSMLNRRINGSFEYYNKRSDNLLLTAANDPTTGVSGLMKNSASMSGSGVETRINTININGRKFKWSSEIGFSSITNKVIDFQADNKGATALLYTSSNGLTVSTIRGTSPYPIFSFQFAGLDAAGNPQGYLGKQVSTNYLGIFNQHPDTAGLVYHGSAIPTKFGFFNNVFSYGKFSLIININYSLGYYTRKQTISYNNLFQLGAGHPDYYKRWQNPGDENKTTVPSMIYPVSNSRRDDFYAYSSVNVVKADNIRLQSVRLSYTLDKTVVKKMPFRQVQFYSTIDNIGFIWRAAGDIKDPDIDRGNGAYPRLKSFAAGLNLMF